jgi:hypothetical protein
VTAVEFASKASADQAREEFAEHLCPDDDRRKKTVRFRSDAPDHVVEGAERMAFDERGRRDARSGQAELTDVERDRIDFSKGNANVLWARSIKAIARDEGVDDWTAYVDPTLTVDEHRGIMADAATEGGGRRLDAEETAEQRAGRAARSAASSECDHAKGHCEHGDQEACEFLAERCGYDDEEIDRTNAGATTLTGPSLTTAKATVSASVNSAPSLRSELVATTEGSRVFGVLDERRENATPEALTFGRIRRDTVEDVARNLYDFTGFASVDLTVVDPKGDVIEDATFIYTREGVFTGGELQNGKGTILLNTSYIYSQFVVVARLENATYGWFDVADVEVRPLEMDEATIVVEPKTLTGLFGGSGIDFGGQLG